MEELCVRIKPFNPDIIGISTFTTFAYLLPSLVPMLRTAFPNAWIVVGGPHASAVQKDVFGDVDIDILVPGEGEIALK